MQMPWNERRKLGICSFNIDIVNFLTLFTSISARLAKKEDEIEAERLRRREAEKAKKRMGGR